MSDWHVLGIIGALGAVSYALRCGGFLAASVVRDGSLVARFLRLAPGNLFVAFVAASCLAGGWPGFAGCLAALLAILVTRREWVALTAGFSAATIVAAVLQGIAKS